MGYYSKFSLTLKEDDGDTLIADDEIVMAVMKDLQATSGYKYLFEHLELGCNEYFNTEYYDEFTDDYKWYNWEVDLRDVSKKYSDIFFIVIRIGERKDDLERLYFKNGKTLIFQKGTIEYKWI